MFQSWRLRICISRLGLQKLPPPEVSNAENYGFFGERGWGAFVGHVAISTETSALEEALPIKKLGVLPQVRESKKIFRRSICGRFLCFSNSIQIVNGGFTPIVFTHQGEINI